jgi:hypothetical protein
MAVVGCDAVDQAERPAQVGGPASRTRAGTPPARPVGCGGARCAGPWRRPGAVAFDDLLEGKEVLPGWPEIGLASIDNAQRGGVRDVRPVLRGRADFAMPAAPVPSIEVFQCCSGSRLRPLFAGGGCPPLTVGETLHLRQHLRYRWGVPIPAIRRYSRTLMTTWRFWARFSLVLLSTTGLPAVGDDLDAVEIRRAGRAGSCARPAHPPSFML